MKKTSIVLSVFAIIALSSGSAFAQPDVIFLEDDFASTVIIEDGDGTYIEDDEGSVFVESGPDTIIIEEVNDNDLDDVLIGLGLLSIAASD